MTRGINSTTDDNETKTSYSKGTGKKSKLPKLLQDKKYRRIPGRYSFPDFAPNILPASKITNIITGKQTTLNHLHKTREIVELQTNDFSGIVMLRNINQKLEIRLGTNELVYREPDDSLIAHQVHFIRFINHGKYRAALEELHYIGLWAERANDKVAILNYFLAEGYVHDLMGQMEISRDYYSQAATHIAGKMNSVEIKEVNDFIIKSYEKRITSHHNWTDKLCGLIFQDVTTSNFDLISEIDTLSKGYEPTKKKSKNIFRLLGIKPYVRIPGSFEIQEFLHNIYPESVLQNSLTKRKYTISSLLKDKHTISIQALDYVGVISLKISKDGISEIKPTTNEFTYGIKEYSLLAHEISFCLFLDRFNTRAALNELENIRNITHESASRQEQFNYMVAHARALLRSRDRVTRSRALIEFEEALEFLHMNFNDDEIIKMTRDHVRISEKNHPNNWNSALIDYDLITLTSLYLTTAQLLNRLDPYNQYGVLLDELLILTDKFNASYDKTAALDLKGILLKDMGDVDGAISCFVELLQTGHESITKNFSEHEFFMGIHQLHRLYLQKGDFVSAQETLNYFSFVENIETNIHAKLYRSWIIMDLYNYQNNSDALITEGLKIYDMLENIDFKFHGSKIHFMIPIFRLLILGTYRQDPIIKAKSDEIIYNVYEINSDSADVPILPTLIKLYKEELLFTQGETALDELISIQQTYNKLLKNYTNYSQYSFKKLVVHYLNFAITYIDVLPNLKDELVEYTDQFIDILMESTNILLTVRTKIVNMALTKRIEELKEWLQMVIENYNIKPLQEIINKVDFIDADDDISVIKEQLLDLAGYDIVHEQYELYQAPPLIKVIVPDTKHKTIQDEPVRHQSINFRPVKLMSRIIQSIDDTKQKDKSNKDPNL